MQEGFPGIENEAYFDSYFDSSRQGTGVYNVL